MAQADPRSGVLTSEALDAVKEKIENMPLPVGYQLEWFGEYKDAKEADEGLMISAPYGFAAMVFGSCIHVQWVFVRHWLSGVRFR